MHLKVTSTINSDALVQDPNCGSRPVPAPAEECWLTVNGIRTRFLRCGSRTGGRPPLLMIHGLIGYSFSWRFNLAALSEAGEVYALDLPGMGYSERAKSLDGSVRGLARHVLRFMDETRIATADVLGTSHGGGVAMLLAAEAPERIRRLVLVASVNPWSEHGRLLTRVLATTAGALLFRCGWPLVARFHGRRLLARMYGDPGRIAPGSAEGYGPPLRIPGTLDYLLSVTRAWHGDLREIERALPSIAQIPALLVWGDRDGAVLPPSAEILRRQFRNSELLMLEGVGHLPYEEVPAAFNRAVIDFLAR